MRLSASFFVSGGSKLKQLANEGLWKDVLLTALDRGKATGSSALPGSKLRGLVVEVARERALGFPPPEFEGQKFGRFLAHFKDRGCIVIRTRDGQDVLVAPSDEPERLVDVPGDGQQATGLRHDLFSAFSTVSSQHAFYRKSDDKFVWLPQEEAVPDGYVPVPAITFGLLTERCIRFGQQLSSEERKVKLEEALRQPRPIAAFTAAVRDLKLQSQWHAFRVREILDRVTAWADAQHIAFQSSWITNSVDGKRPESDVATAVAVSKDRRSHWLQLIQMMSDDDLSRVMMPMEIAAKLLGR